MDKYDELINVCTILLNQNENDKTSYNYKDYVEAYLKRGRAYHNQNKSDKAIEDYKKAIEINNKCTEAYIEIGVVYTSQKKYEEARKSVTKAIEINPKDKIAYRIRGTIYLNKGLYDKAIYDYTYIIDNIDENYELAYRYRILAYEKKGNIKEAEREKKRFNVRIRDKMFYKYIENSDIENEKKLQIYDLYLKVIELKNIFLYKNYEQVGHYTKIGNLKHLLKPEDKENNSEKEKKGARLRLNNVAYMNDPTEGEVFLELLNKYNNKDVKELLDIIYRNQNENADGREILNGKNHVFLVSFSNAIDKLPMWVQYSDNGKGACLVFNKEFFDKEDKNQFGHISCRINENSLEIDSEECRDRINEEDSQTYYCLYQVKYIDMDNNEKKHYKDSDEIKELIKEIGKRLLIFKDELEGNENSRIKEIVLNILDQVRFLFKDKSYDHEEEVRLVKFEDNGNVKYTGDAEGYIVPHVYIEMDRELNKDTINEVILGPKVENSIEIANYLYYTDKVNMVTRSKIKYK